MNYQIELDNLLEGLKKNEHLPSLCLHSCCAPCSSYVLSYLMEYFAITVLYYNPNIYPPEEFDKRLAEQERLIGELNRVPEIRYELNGQTVTRKRKETIRLAVPSYDHEEFLLRVKGLEKEPEGGSRCEACFSLRLSRTYSYAKEKGFDYFGTTLSVSPHKNAVVLNTVGTSFEDPPCFLLSDFKKREGYKTSILLSQKYGLYRQSYCGCEFAFSGQI